MRACLAILACAIVANCVLPTTAQSDLCADAPLLADGKLVFSTIDATTEYPERPMCVTGGPL